LTASRAADVARRQAPSELAGLAAVCGYNVVETLGIRLKLVVWLNSFDR